MSGAATRSDWKAGVLSRMNLRHDGGSRYARLDTTDGEISSVATGFIPIHQDSE